MADVEMAIVLDELRYIRQGQDKLLGLVSAHKEQISRLQDDTSELRDWQRSSSESLNKLLAEHSAAVCKAKELMANKAEFTKGRFAVLVALVAGASSLLSALLQRVLS